MNRQQVTSLIVAAIYLMLATGGVFATTPKLISYQGRATDASGSPVADGIHSVQFEIYDTNNNMYWSESATVTTSGGLFSHNLGSVTPMNSTIFDYRDSLFLQITFEGEVQSPRTLFTTSPYAFYVNSINGSEGGIVNGIITVHSDAADDEIVGIEATTENGKIWLKDVDGLNRIELKSESREIDFYDFAMTSTPATISSQGSSIMINPDQTGNSSVYLPNNAIGKNEIIDEPGIANSISESFLPLIEDIFNDLVTTSISIPSPGYIVLFGKSVFDQDPTNGNGWYMQIDETPGGGITDLNCSVVISDHFATCTHYTSGHCSHVYYKSAAGTYTFRLEAMKMASGDINSWYPTLLATYVPTSYGVVESIVSGQEAGQFEDLEMIQDKDGNQHYKVDLRELELKAAKAEAEVERVRADAEKAQRELLRARYESSNDQDKE